MADSFKARTAVSLRQELNNVLVPLQLRVAALETLGLQKLSRPPVGSFLVYDRPTSALAWLLLGEIDHNQLLNYDANEHIDWTNASENFNTTGTFTLAGTTGLDHGEVTLLVTGQTWSIRNNATTKDLVLHDSTNSKSPVKIATNSNSNLLLLANDEVNITGKLDVSGGIGIGSGVNLVALVPKTIDETITSNATLQNDNALVFSAAASSVYLVEIIGAFNSGTTPDFQYDFTLPTGASGKFYDPLSIAGTGIYSAMNSATPRILVGHSTNDIPLIVTAIVTIGSTAGNIQLQWAQNTSDASNTTVRAGSIMKVWKVA